MSHNTHSTVGQNPEQVLFTLREDDCKLQNANCKLQNEGRRSPSPVPRPLSPRSGISLTEVLIAMGILTVGLLGVASVFPVASFYMQKGDIATNGSAIAQAAFNDALARGMFNPANWLIGESASVPYVQYTRPYQTTLKTELARQASETTVLTRSRALNSRIGYAYVIDPIGLEGSPRNSADPTDRGQNLLTQTFPFKASGLVNFAAYPSWWPWNPMIAPTGTWSPILPRWPVIRVTLPGIGTTTPITRDVADKLFRSGDDLALELPDRADQPSQQVLTRFDVNSDGRLDPMSRSSRGDYSWLATIVPSTSDARDALAQSGGSHSYEASVAVQYKRVVDNLKDLTPDSRPMERLINAKVVSTGLSGGELLLTKYTADAHPEPFSGLKVGNWIAICGPHPASNNQNPQFVLRWYRVLSIETNNSLVADKTNQRLVTLRGPQWPWQPAANLTASDLPNTLCAVILPNVVAVHTKSIELDGNSSWNIR